MGITILLLWAGPQIGWALDHFQSTSLPGSEPENVALKQDLTTFKASVVRVSDVYWQAHKLYENRVSQFAQLLEEEGLEGGGVERPVPRFTESVLLKAFEDARTPWVDEEPEESPPAVELLAQSSSQTQAANGKKFLSKKKSAIP